MIFKLKILYFYLKTKYGHRFRNRASLLAWQKKKVSRFLSWVVNASPYYKKSIQDFNDIPMIDKKIMMENFTELNTVDIDREEAFKLALQSEQTRNFSPTLNGITVGLSSGTSGSRGLFLVSEHERARHAGTMMAKILPHSIFSKNRVAFFMRANSNLYSASKSSRLQFEFFDLLTPLEQHFVRLQNFNPTLLFAPPSLLIEIAKAVKAGFISISPLKIFSIAETLDPLDEKNIEQAFHQKVHQIYQCTEGFLGVTCKEGTLHLNEDCVRIEQEWVNEEKTKFIPIVTDFTRTSQPIIRYRLNDLLTIKNEPCACGSPFMALEFIEGRSDDVLYFISQNLNHQPISVYPDFLRRAVISASDEIQEYLVRQSKPGLLEISIQTNAHYEEVCKSIQNEMIKLCEKLNAELPNIQFSTNFPELNGKKLQRVMRVREKSSINEIRFKDTF